MTGSTSATSPTCPNGGSGAAATALPALAASMGSGQWSTLTMGGMTASLLDAGNGYAIVDYAARGHWDPVHKKIQFWGQGHYSAEKLITWDEATNQWSVGTPAGFGGIGHAYYHLALDPGTGDLYLHSYNSSEFKKKSYGGAWTRITTGPNNPNQITGALEWLPSLNNGAGGLVYVDPLIVQTWNPASNSWSVRATAMSGMGPYHGWSAVAGGSVYFGGGNGSSVMYRMNAAGSVSAAPSTPLTAGINNAGIVIRHPDGNQLLMFGQGATGTIHRFDGTAWVSHGTHQIGGDQGSRFGVPIPDYGIVLFVVAGGATPTVKVYKP